MDKTLDLVAMAYDAGYRNACGDSCGCLDGENADSHDRDEALTLIAAARPAVVSDEVVPAVFDEFNRQFRGHVEAMRAALALLPGGEGEGSSRSLPSRTTQEPQSPTPCDLEGK